MNRRPPLTLVPLVLLSFVALLPAGQSPREMHAYRGSRPNLDGVIAPAEYQDATRFLSFDHWGSVFHPVTNPEDLSVTGYIKHDGQDLYLAFDVTDDVLYAVDTERWLPDENPLCHEFSPTGWSWFGDGVEVFMNPSYVWTEYDSRGNGDRWQDVQFNDGSGRSWQVACNASKSWLGRLKQGGLMPAEQRVNVSTFQTYTQWIERGDMQVALKIKPDRKGYVIEWKIKPNPCLEVKPGVFWTPEFGTAKMGFNLAVQDLDERERGQGNFGHMNHEDWWAGAEERPYQLQHFGTLYLHPSWRPHEIHVGPDRTLRTLEAAQTQVRELVKKGLDRDILVILQGGRYELDEPLTLTPLDSGTDAHSITYTPFPAYTWPGERVVISGGQRLAQWQQVSNRLWRVKIPESFTVRQLFKDGQRLPRSRTPNQGTLKIKQVHDGYTRLTFDKVLLDLPVDQTLTELVTIQNWALCRGIVTEVKDNVLTTATPMAWLGHSALRAKPGNPAYLENHPQFIDQDEEWCFDPQSHTVTYLAPAGENPNEREFIVPALERLVILEGTAASPLKNVHFRSLQFAHATWTLPSIGYRGIQAGYHGTSEKPPKPVFCQPAAIECRFVENSSFELCDISHTGATGLGLGAGCRGVRIAGCRVTDTGCNGIQVGHRTGALMGPANVLDKDWDTQREIPTANVVTSNQVRTCGQISSGAVGIFDAFANGSQITHNLITETPYTGISVGYRWNTQPSSQQNTRVEYNQICNVLNDVVDGGGIYTLGVQPGTIFRGNLIYEVHRSDFGHGAPNNGFFLDEGSKGYTLEGNIVFATSGKPVRHNKNEPAWHTWKNNVFNTGPGDINFPWSAAGQAGLSGAYRLKVLEREN